MIEVLESSQSEHDFANTLVTLGEQDGAAQNAREASPALEDAIVVETALSPASKRPAKGNKARQLKKLIEVTRDINFIRNQSRRNLPKMPFGRNLERSNIEGSSDQNVKSAKSFEVFSNMQLKKHVRSEAGFFSNTHRPSLQQSKSREISRKTELLTSRASAKPQAGLLLGSVHSKLNASLEHFSKRGASQGAQRPRRIKI